MEAIIVKAKEWGNSLGITIPKSVAKKEGIIANKEFTILIDGNAMKNVRKLFGQLKPKMSTQKAMEEIDKGYD